MNTNVQQTGMHAGLLRVEAALRVLRAQWMRIQRTAAAARSRRELHALSDRALKDIGLNRAEIDSLFR